MIQETLYSIQTSYATFAIVAGRYSQVVIDAAPIAKWAIGKSIASVLRYYSNRGAIIHRKYIRYYR